MARMAIDFTKAGNKNYRVYRVLQCNSEWSDVYRKRIQNFGSLRSSIIFPEMMLGLNQNVVFFVKQSIHGRDSIKEVSLSIASIPLTRFQIVIDDYPHPLKDQTQIEIIENIERSPPVDELLKFHDGIKTYGFANSPLFSGKVDALKYAVRWLEDSVKSNL